ncbi:MAG: dihydrolipoyllysine-residue acetyltransferase [Rhodocyclaceae bacterium]|nr:dihydrolipoyllysine-residue acetyltransferase [Rhodocyclaceae bacterium]
MSQLVEIKVPDIGDFSDVPVIELFVKVGDALAVDDAICTLESDKATMDVPAPAAGIVREVCVSVGTRVSEGALLLKLERSETAAAPEAPAAASGAEPTIDLLVPDIGDFHDVPVIEVFVKTGDTLAVDDAICTLESDKATMDVPASAAGVLTEVCVKVGDKVSQGALLGRLRTAAANVTQTAAPQPAVAAAPAAATQSAPAPLATPAPAASAITLGGAVHASPSVRAFARELGVDLAQVRPTGPKNRILREDVTAFVKATLTSGAPAAGGARLGGGLDLLPWPQVDFSKFGETEVRPLSRIQKISAQNLARNWAMIPAVTYHEDADITALEAFRVQLNQENAKSGRKLTMLAFLIKAAVRALQEFPTFNSSLDGENLICKKYFHIAFAADTPHGLVVPVVKDADRKSIYEIAEETGALAKKAREGKLGPAEMSGACFTISSLGGIGGTYFAPIINAPEVAILGVNKSVMKPVWDGEKFAPRLILPLSLTADHRVIDGALATRFNVYLATLLADFRRVLL